MACSGSDPETQGKGVPFRVWHVAGRAAWTEGIMEEADAGEGVRTAGEVCVRVAAIPEGIARGYSISVLGVKSSKSGSNICSLRRRFLRA